MIQYFIGLVPPQDFKEDVIRFQRRWPQNRTPDIVEPHVTVKAQSGLTEDLGWLQRVRDVCGEFQPFTLQLKGPELFDENVLFLDVDAPAAYQLHHALLEAVNPSAELRTRYFEDGRYHLHLTLTTVWHGVSPADLHDMRDAAAQEIEPIAFPVESVRVYRVDTEQSSYYETYLDLPLGGRTTE